MPHAPLNRRDFLKLTGLGAAALGMRPSPAEAQRPPNVIVILTDDQGYGDMGSQGAEGYATPNLDRMAQEGTRFTAFYASAPVCSPSRAALMTGCYPPRVGLPFVLAPRRKEGINPDEVTMAELLKSRGYATACFGKWHLGHHPEFLPIAHGFDEYYGLPYSNDMWPNHPVHPEMYPPLPLMEGTEVIETNPDQRKLTTSYTERAVQFIERNKEQPFFLYLAHSMPHVPLYVSEKFDGKSEAGLYGDVMMEIDWSVGQVLDTVRNLGITEDTFVFFSSDNGPWLLYGDHAGSAGPLRCGKGTTFEGGQRTPCIMWRPGRIPAGNVCDTPCGLIDILPTIAAMAGAEAPEDRIIDGRDLGAVLTGESREPPHEYLYYYRGDNLQAIRDARWKLHLPHTFSELEEPGKDGQPGKYAHKKIGLALFDLVDDPGEQHDVAEAHPGVVERLRAQALHFDKALQLSVRPCGLHEG